MRLFLTGSVQSVFFDEFIKKNAEQLNVRGFVRTMEDGRKEIFLEGDNTAVDAMNQICRKGDKHTVIRNVDEKMDRFQDFKDFRVMKI